MNGKHSIKNYFLELQMPWFGWSFWDRLSSDRYNLLQYHLKIKGEVELKFGKQQITFLSIRLSLNLTPNVVSRNFFWWTFIQETRTLCKKRFSLQCLSCYPSFSWVFTVASELNVALELLILLFFSMLFVYSEGICYQLCNILCFILLFSHK